MAHAPLGLLLTYAPKYTRALIVGDRWCVFEKYFPSEYFPSLHFTDNVVELASSVAVGLTFKDFLTTFRLVCHVVDERYEI